MVHPAHLPQARPALIRYKVRLFKILVLALLIGMASGANLAFSQEQEVEPTEGRQKIRQILLLLSDQILRVQKELGALNTMPATKTVNEQKEKLIQQLDGLNRNFESLATKLDTGDLYLAKDEESQWINQLKGLTLPLLEAIGDITKKPRRIEALKKRVSALEIQLEKFEAGQKNIQGLMQMDIQDLDPKNPPTQKYLATLKTLQEKYNTELVRVQLEEARNNLENDLQGSVPLWESVTQAIKNFFKHRGLNLLITVGVFLVLWYLMIKLRVFIIGEKSLIKVQPWMRKIMVTAYSAMVLVLCIITSLIALYFLNDWLLLSVIILFLVAVVWASRQFIPRLFQEVRLALNLGTARENERLIWNGVPWKIDNLSLQATLSNPRLEGGKLQLPLGELIGKHSRPIVEGEPWFPTQIGNWVRLSDGTYGRVDHQTMEQVILRLKGDTLKYYSTPEFLDKTPMNLSQGFRYAIDFGLDYREQSRICDEIPKLFEKGLWTYLEHHHQNESPDFTYTGISFDHAGSSSLNLKVIVHVEGRCAERYEEIEREIQSTLVRLCNENNLVIPFNQLTVTLPENLKPKTES